MNVKREEDCYDESTDDEGAARLISRPILKPVAVKKEEDVDTDDELPGTDDSGANAAEKGQCTIRVTGDAMREMEVFASSVILSHYSDAAHVSSKLGAKGERNQRSVKRTFEERVEELAAYKAKHGNIDVKRSKNSLYQFCWKLRQAHKGLGTMKLTEERIASLDTLGFDWEPKKAKSFQERLDDLKAYKTQHGHLKVQKSEDKSLYPFCVSIRFARRHPERSRTKLTEDRIASLDALGFNWKMLPENEIMESEEQSTARTLPLMPNLPPPLLADSDDIDIVEV